MPLVNLGLALLISGYLGSSFAHAQKPQQSCRVRFSVVQHDGLGNVDVGFSPADAKWFTKIARHYPDICYAEQPANEGTWFYIDISSRSSDNSTAHSRSSVDGSGSVSTHTTIRTGAQTVYTLKIGQFKDTKLLVLRTFQRVQSGSSGGTVTGVVRSFKNAERDVILDGLDWLNTNSPAP